MIRFRVVRASRLLVGLAVLLLVAALALLAFRLAGQRQQPVSGAANLVSRNGNGEARTEVVFASSDHSADAILPADTAGLEIEFLPTRQPAPTRVLIYHTHTHEAYEQVIEDPYDAIEAWRTEDVDHSVVRVGAELARRLRLYGFEVVHDTTDHEGNQLSTAYTRSLETLKSYQKRFDLYIDLHRDAYAAGDIETVKTDTGEALAPLMLLIGNGKGFDEKPYYEENLAFAEALKARIDAAVPGLCKPVLVKDGRYNQNIGVFAILVEVGHNRNTLKQALRAVPPLADALYSLLEEDPDPNLVSMKNEEFGIRN